MSEAWLQRWWRPLLALGVALHVTQLFGALLEPDSALYASIARHLVDSGDWVKLVARGHDWLDKPHLPFWLEAVSLSVFGGRDWAFRLPGLAVFLLGARYTYRLGALLFNQTVAQLSVLVLLFAQHALLSTADVRMEPFLTGFLTAAVFHLLRGRESWRDFVFGCAFLAAAVMSKGPFVVLPVIGALFAWEWRRLPTARLVLAPLLTLLFIAPELWCLWEQFGAYGLRFFFWDNQFGRFTSLGPIHGPAAGFLFFFHTVLWAFAPWGFWLYAALFAQLRERGPVRHLLGAIVPTFLMFAASRHQLPHYLNLLFPFFALLVARWLTTTPHAQRVRWLAELPALALPLFAGALLVLNQSIAFTVALFAATLATFIFVKPVFARTSLIMVAVNLALAFGWWPDVLEFEAGVPAARAANALPPAPTQVVNVLSHAFNFYTASPTSELAYDDLKPGRVLTREVDAQTLSSRFQVTELGRFENFRVSKPSLRFLDARTRHEATEKWVLIELR